MEARDLNAWRQVLRVFVFIPGALLGLWVAATATYFGADKQIQAALLIWLPLLMILATPACWVLAARTAAGDRWTVGYLFGWIAYLASAYLAAWIF